MLIKEASPSPYLLKLTALMNRLPDDLPAKSSVIKEWYKQSAGYDGERSLDYYLSFLEEKDYLIFHNLRLPSGKYFFQIDILILTDYYCLIIESKNISGELYFDSNYSQLIKMENEKEIVLGDPFSQVRHQNNQLAAFFNNFRLPPLQIEYLVALTNKKAIIKKVTGSNGEHHKLCRGTNVLEKIRRLEKYIAPDRISPKELKKLSKTLLNNHTPLETDILKQFHISKEDLLTGVRCPNCSFLPMSHTYGKWTCPNCGRDSKEAHKDTLKDYFLLFGPNITNKEFRWFTRVKHRHIATHLLSSMDLNRTGSNRGCVYKKQ